MEDVKSDLRKETKNMYELQTKAIEAARKVLIENLGAIKLLNQKICSLFGFVKPYKTGKPLLVVGLSKNLSK